jgi:hypothetical protein
MTNQQAQLQWRTETESNNCRFEIERSANGSNFTLAGTVPGAVNSSTPKQYGYTDVSPLPGRSYYRIRQVDCDGKSSYSRVISLQNDPAGFTIYPNPVADAITIDRNRAGQVQATVYDLAGRALIAQRISNVRERVSAVGLVPGTYIIKVESGSGTVTQKFIKK